MPEKINTAELLPVIDQVIDGDLCIACGACLPACPFDNVKTVFNGIRGSLEAKIITPAQCHTCDKPCDSVCPSISIDFVKAKASINRCGQEESRPLRDDWIRSVHLGWAPDYRDDGVSSSGGVLRAMVASTLDSGKPVICLALDPEDNQLKPRLLTKLDDMKHVPGSIYHSTSFAGAIDLIRDAEMPVMLVAIPCQLAGILQYVSNCEEALAENIEVVVGLICGWMFSHHSLSAFAQHKKLSDPITDVRYRGGDRVGKLKLIMEGKELSFDRRNFKGTQELIDYHSSFSTDFNRLRCRVCEDHINLLSDVTVGDAWLKRKTSEKVSVVVTRSSAGEKLLIDLGNSGRIKLENSSFDDLIESQSENLICGTVAKKISLQLTERGDHVPRYGFRDSDINVSVSILDRLKFKVEMFKRGIVRKKHFRLYRILYVMLRPFLALRFLAKIFLLKR